MRYRLRILTGVIAALVMMLGYSAWNPPTTQTAITMTTTAAAVAAADTSVLLTSDTGVAAGTAIYIDNELMVAISEQGATARWNVRRGQEGTAPAMHATAARVFVGSSGAFGRNDVTTGGACTATEHLYKPYINTRTGRIWDCELGFWMEWHRLESVNVRSFTVRDEFDQGYSVMQDDGTVKSVTDAEEDFVTGSPLGAIEYREEQTKTVSSWVTINGQLDISADNTTSAEGVEIVFGATSDAALNQVIEVGTSGACFAAMVTIADISAVDELVIGWRQNEAFVDTILYETYDEYAIIGVQDVAGDLDVEDEEAGAGVQNDDVGVTWADGERRALKVCISKTGVPTFYYTAASPDATRPAYIQVVTTNTGDALTAGDGMVPFLAFLISGTDGPNVTIQFAEITRIP